MSATASRRRQRRDFVSEFGNAATLSSNEGLVVASVGLSRDGLEITRVSHNRGHGAQLFQLFMIYRSRGAWKCSALTC